MRRLFIVIAVFITAAFGVGHECYAAIISQGTLDGAHYSIAVPDNHPWNGNVLLIAHGYRPESAPLVADLFPEQAAYRTLIDEGWIVAKTSYRRNGIIISDAITDLDNLRAEITKTFGVPQQVLVEGDSMGGTIATLIAERGGTHYQGSIAIGPALDLRESKGASGVSLNPRIPLLFVANRSEIDGPTAYVSAAQPNSPDETIPPALFRIDRDGHVNVNQAERLFAIRALCSWLEHGRNALPRSDRTAKFFDATQAVRPRPSEVRIDPDSRGVTATVIEISAIYGNVWLNLQPADLERINLTSGLWAELEIGANRYRVRHGTDFASVERGQWVLFPNADGYYWLARNRGNAADTARLNVGDSVHLRRFPNLDRN